uniref:Uncharacterized protein n=1 Tax=Cacopsylla melanoneura TaxID=428564 RepID=A0A8D9BRY0_9HEMI
MVCPPYSGRRFKPYIMSCYMGKKMEVVKGGEKEARKKRKGRREGRGEEKGGKKRRREGREEEKGGTKGRNEKKEEGRGGEGRNIYNHENVSTGNMFLNKLLYCTF